MVTELLLAGLLIAFFVYHLYYVKNSNEQVTHLVKLLKARDLIEYNTTLRAEADTRAMKNIKVTSFNMDEKPLGDLIPMEQVDDRLFDKMVQTYTEGEEK